MNAHDPWTVQPPVLHPVPPGGDAQIAAIRAMRPYVPAQHAHHQPPRSFVVLHLFAGAVIGIVAFVTLCAGFWFWEQQARGSASVGPANAPVVRGFEGG